MTTKTIYITVRLDIETTKTDRITDKEVDNLISEMDYSFKAPEGDFKIYDTEICGLND